MCHMGDIQTDIALNDLWTIYFHDPYDEKWTFESYERIDSMSSVHDFWKVHLMLKEKIHCGMFFIMRDHIFPCWDDPYNKDGGCLSIKVLKQEMKNYWEQLCVSLIAENLVVNQHRSTFWKHVNGISTSPKKSFCIIKIWLSSNDCKDLAMFNIPKEHYGDIIYKSNTENMVTNHNCVLPIKT